MVIPAKYRSVTSWAFTGSIKLELFQGFVQCDQIVRRHPGGQFHPFQVDSLQFPSVLGPLLPPGIFDEDPPHGFSRRSEEVTASVPLGEAASGPINRKYASWTKAVACSVCPGFSWASLAAAKLRNSS